MAKITTANAGTSLDINSLWDLMNELYDVRKKWKLIGLGLRLPPSDLDAMSGDPLECLQNSLSQWLNGIDPLPTWDALIAVLRSRVVGEEKKAQELEEKFCRVTPTATNTAKESATPPSQSETGDSSVTSPTHDQHEVTQKDGESSEKSLTESVDDQLSSSPARPSLLSYLEKIYDAEVKLKVKQKDNQFRTLVRRTHRHISCTIETKGGGLADFKVAVTLLPGSLDGYHILLSPDDRNAISNASSFDQIFVVLNQYWTFVQYELLEYVVQEYGNDDLKKEMKKYIADMEELEAQVGIDHFTAVKLCAPRPDSVAMEVHLSGSQHKLHSARLVQRAMAEQCGLHPHAVRTFQSTPGSTIITLLIPYAVAGHAMATLHGMKPAGDLLSRPLEERVVYTMDEAETEMYLPLNTVASADVPVVAGRRERRGSGDSSSTISTGYDSLLSEGESSVVGEPHSQIATLTRALREREKEAEDFQHKLSEQSMSEKPAKGESRAVCILGSVAPHSNESVVPQSPADLSNDDREMLSGLGLPLDKWDNLNVLLAVYGRTENYDVFSVQVSKPGMELSRNYVLQQIEFLLMTSLNKKGAVIHYYGSGRRNTGDWCFRDGYITFRDITSLYMKHSRGRVLTLVPDCHSSGHWVSECAKFLDEQGVRPCGHSAIEKGILLKVYATCRTGQDTAELCYTTRAMKLKDDGYVYHWISKELSTQQKTLGVNFIRMRCGKREEEECSIASDSTWSTAREITSDRLFIVRGSDGGRPAWRYILLDDDAEKIRDFIHKINVSKSTISLTNYGTILKSGWGRDPPQDVKDWIEKYGRP